MTDDAERERRVAEVIRKTAVLELPGMDRVEIRGEQRYGDGGTFDLYVATSALPAPTVLFVYGFPDQRFAQGLRQMGSYASWGRLLAASGMNAVAYSYREPVSDLAALLGHLRQNAGALGIDAARLGVWSASGNVPTALHLLMTQPPDAFRAAVLLYGYMLDVPEAAEQFGIGVLARGVRSDRRPLPRATAAAGRARRPAIRRRCSTSLLDAFVSAALARDLPLTLINQPGAPHSFDLFDDKGDASRATIRRIVSFLGDRLATSVSSAR